MKAVLLIINPKYCELIASGRKTVEIRKTRPKIDTPFKCYIYCTKEKVPGEILLRNGEVFGQNKGFRQNGDIPLAGKVIGEFICDEIEDFSNYSVIAQYLKSRKCGYGWHISDLKIYDEPKNLDEFEKPCSRDCKNCKYWYSSSPIDYEPPCCEWEEYVIQRPPQSWCYVEDLEGAR